MNIGLAHLDFGPLIYGIIMLLGIAMMWWKIMLWALEDAYANVRQIRADMDSARSLARVLRPVIEEVDDDCCLP